MDAKEGIQATLEVLQRRLLYPLQIRNQVIVLTVKLHFCQQKWVNFFVVKLHAHMHQTLITFLFSRVSLHIGRRRVGYLLFLLPMKFRRR
jgi:hypothetical protein